MSEEPLPYSQTYIQAWTVLSLIVTAVIFIAFCFGQIFLADCRWIWDLLRYLASPII
jgi:hypothetical protein